MSGPLPYQSARVRASGLDLHYLTCGDGPPVLLLHGWPTSSFLWRHTLGPLGKTNRAIALDLPGFGRSDKPLDASYSFRFFEQVLEDFLDAIGVGSVGLAVHDLGGPIGLYWGLRNPGRVSRLALLNTLVYPRPTAALLAFVGASYVPLLRDFLVSPLGLDLAVRLGLGDRRRATREVIRAVQAPFRTAAARQVLLKNAHALHPEGMVEIARRLPAFRGPVRLIYGTKDRILPDVARTMADVARDLPQAVVTRLEGCGHFCQEERGPEIGAMLSEHFR